MTVVANMIDISAVQHPPSNQRGGHAPIAYKEVYDFLLRNCKPGDKPKVMIKATELSSLSLQGEYVNPFLAVDGHGFHAVGAEVGYYAYLHPGVPVKNSIDFLMEHIDLLPRTIGVMADLEETDGESWPVVATYGEAFLRGLPASVVNRSLYSNGDFLSNMPGAPWGNHLIYAWPGLNGEPNPAPGPNRTCWAWQFDWVGQVPGIQAETDLMHFYGAAA